MAELDYLSLPINADEGFPQAFRLAFNNNIYTLLLYVNAPEEKVRAMADDGFFDLPARDSFATGQVQVTLANAAVSRTYLIPQETILVTVAPVRAFFTTAALTLSATKTQDTVTVQAFERGPAGNIPAATIVGVDPGYAHTFLNLGQATLTVTNPAAFTGGDQHAFMVMRVARETAGEPQVIFQRKLVLKHEYAASELAFRFTRIHVAKGNFNGVGSFGSQVEGLVAARWAS
jgi:hypothetical protein